ncbi:group III truncated hemoglobin [Flavobacterium sp.]|uniref:group III truncated hemoglobin n=1 Tax=Flavobacterium sp. TaxID=239 RepID=UPI003528E186
MKDIENRQDILLIMQKFYDKLLADSTINFFFTETTTVSTHLNEHFETLANFWEQALFLKGGYRNNMFQKHLDVHKKMAFTSNHFQTWLNHLHSTIDENYEGNYAEQMKTMAQSIATVMQIKLS